MEQVEIGKIVTVRGVRGEVKVLPWADSADFFDEIDTVYIEEKAYPITGRVYVKSCVCLKLKGVDTVEAARALVGKQVYIDEEQLPPVGENTYYIRDLIGMRVLEGEKEIGRVRDVFSTGANDVYEVVDGSGKQILIPAISQCVLEINVQEKYMRVALLEGLR